MLLHKALRRILESRQRDPSDSLRMHKQATTNHDLDLCTEPPASLLKLICPILSRIFIDDIVGAMRNVDFIDSILSYTSLLMLRVPRSSSIWNHSDMEGR